MATALVIEGDVLGNDAHGQMVQAPLVPAKASFNVTYSTSTATSAFQSDTRIVTVCAIAAAAYVKFGLEGVTCTMADDGFDGFIPANSVISYVINPTNVDRVAVYDGAS